MNPSDLLKSIYLGDSYCTRFVIDENKNQVEIHMDSISRIRDASGQWNYYTDEDIENGVIVINGVKKIELDESGLQPNDEVYEITVKEIGKSLYEFIIETSNVDDAITIDLKIKLIGEEIYLYDPLNPAVKICE